jgi:two-component system, cell cycle response regulator
MVKILLAEDDAVSRRLLQAMLEAWGYDVVVTRDGNEAWEALSVEDAPSLAVLDWVMPGIEGVEICRRLRNRRGGYVYTILLTGRDRKQDIVEGMNAGADDYLTKPYDAHELLVRVRAGRRILDLQAALLAAQEVLRQQAARDPLTGVWNRARVFESLATELARAWREDTPVSVIMADLDHFKAVNDAHGHMAGDAVLRTVTRRIQSSLRAYDVLGRYGGEEFLIVLPGCDAPSAAATGERIRQAIAASPIDTSEGLIPVTMSLGTASVRHCRTKPGLLVRAADEALYVAKREGRNRVAQADPAATTGVQPAPARPDAGQEAFA